MLKNLKSLFVVISEDEKAETPTEASATTGGDENQHASVPAVSSSTGIGTPNDQIMDKLLSVIEANNIEGFDYIEYKKALQALAKMPMDEQIRFQSAFATAATMGATVEVLLSSIKTYQGLLSKENDVFLDALKGQVETKVSAKEEEVKKLQAGIVEKTNQIKRLSDEINASHERIGELHGKIEQGKSSIEQTKRNFTATYDLLIKQIEADAQKISQYLK
jgi:predicted RNase H-like nuclease (RuvC/YqgF family)